MTFRVICFCMISVILVSHFECPCAECHYDAKHHNYALHNDVQTNLFLYDKCHFGKSF